MRTLKPVRPARSPGSESEAADRTGVASLWHWLVSAALVAAVGAGILWFFLSLYVAKGYTVPLGWDTSHYLWNTALARSVGMTGVEDLLGPTMLGIPGRPGFPVLAGFLSSLGGVSAFRVAAVLPAVMAAFIGLGAGAFLASTLRRSAWELAAVAVAVGTSSLVLRMAAPEAYQDNLMAGGVFMAAAPALAATVRDRGALLPAMFLLGAGGVVHWAFFLLMAGVVLLTAATYLPASWGRWRRGEQPLLATPTARLAGATLGGTALAGAMIYGVLGGPPRTPRLSVSEFVKKLRSDLQKYRLWFLLPAAGVGAAGLAVEARTRRDGSAGGREESGIRFVLAFLLSWCGVTAVGFLAYRVLGYSVPIHRILAFTLALPMLAVLGVLWAGGLAGRVLKPLGVVLVLAAVGVALFFSHVQWFKARPWMDPAKISSAATIGRYLDAAGVPVERPVVLVANNGGPSPSSYFALMAHMLRAGLPVERIPHAYVYVGSPENLLEGRPTLLPGMEAYNAMSQRYFANMSWVLPHDPVIVIASKYNRREFPRWMAAHPESRVGPGVAVVSGPKPPAAVQGGHPALGPFRARELILLSFGSFALILAIGLGWAIVLLRPWLDRLQLLAVAPGVGVAVIVLGGTLADRLGIRMAGPGGAVTPIAIGAVGWVVAAAPWARSRLSRATSG